MIVNDFQYITEIKHCSVCPFKKYLKRKEIPFECTFCKDNGIEKIIFELAAEVLK